MLPVPQGAHGAPARGLRGVAFDLPGLGLAERPEGFDYSWTGLGRFAAAAMPERVRSLTVLNTMVEVETFRRPWSMEPFVRRGLGEAYLATLSKPAMRLLVDLLKRGDRGRAFLRIMRRFERTGAKRDLYVSTLRDAPYPVQVVWGGNDPALTLDRHGEDVRRAAGLDEIHALSATHFLQEDQAPAIGERVAAIAPA